MRPHSRRVLLLLAASALAARALLVPAVPRASPLALRTLRDIAVVGARLGEMQQAVRPAAEYGTDAGDELRTLSSTLNASTAEMVSSLQALQLMVQKTRFDSRLLQEPAQPAEGLKALRGQASTLHRQIDEQRELLLLLEEQESGAASRTTALFNYIDTNGDGWIQLDEFEEVAGQFSLLTLGEAQKAQLRAELVARFKEADADGARRRAIRRRAILRRQNPLSPEPSLRRAGNEKLCFDEFTRLLAALKGDALGPLRTAFAEALQQLLDVTLQMTALSLAKELSSRTAEVGRVSELSNCVERWCALEETAVRLAAAPAPPPAAAAAPVEELLAEVGELAAQLSVTNVTGTVEWTTRRVVRQVGVAVSGLRSALGFCWRGLAIMGRDWLECGQLLARRWKGKAFKEKDVALFKRTAVDVVMLIPYSIIMVVPLTPPGHVFAFSLLKRCFPAAVPSGFTEERQDIYDIYSRVSSAAEASAPPTTGLVASLKRLRPVRTAKRFISRSRKQGEVAAA